MKRYYQPVTEFTKVRFAHTLMRLLSAKPRREVFLETTINSPEQGPFANHPNTRQGTGQVEPRIELSILIPAKNEVNCIHPLAARLQRATEGLRVEVIFIDDSSDGTREKILEAQQRYTGLRIIPVFRTPNQSVGGLGSAVVQGLKVSKGEWVCVMDADLQHPPERIPEMLEKAKSSQADLIVASRMAAAQGFKNLALHRAEVSYFLLWLTHLLFPGRLKKVLDPLTGFFLLRRSRIEPGSLAPRGFKILLEILLKFPELSVIEIPFQIENRHAGTSKAGLREGLHFLWHLVILRTTVDTRFFGFLVVGITGLIVNTILLAVFTDVFGVHYLLSVIAATQGSTLWNFALLNRWVFGPSENTRGPFRRIIEYLAVNNLLLAFRAPLLAFFTAGLGIHYLISNLASIALFTVLRFMLSDRWIWAKDRRRQPSQLFHYNIHNLLKVESAILLPELEYFRVDEALNAVDIRIRVNSHKDVNLAAPAGIIYDEGLRDFGFWLQVLHGDPTEVVVSPLLAHSPHVLYTNVVEPILRWGFVRRGWVLLHGACLAHDGRAILVTARTDTGKTTTILKSLAAHPFTFLSDDMVLLNPSGLVRCYPKPLTISLHTLPVVKNAQLTFGERLGLQVQSRLHSRLGRHVGLWLSRLRLPTASLNAVVQMLIPPPKYRVERLVPGVRYLNSARLSHLTFIERGPDYEEIMGQPEITRTLLENAEDAYGFPPYPVLASSLSHWNGEDLHKREQEIIRTAVQGVPAVRLRRSAFDWWKFLPGLFYGQPFGKVEKPFSSKYPTIPNRRQRAASGKLMTR